MLAHAFSSQHLTLTFITLIRRDTDDHFRGHNNYMTSTFTEENQED